MSFPVKVGVLAAITLLVAVLLGGVLGRADSEEQENEGDAPTLAAGSVPVTAPSAVSSLGWDLVPSDPTHVASTTLKFAGLLAITSFICVQVRDDSTTILANGCITLGDRLLAGQPVTVGFDSDPSPMPSTAAITSVDVTVTEPVSPLLCGGLFATIVGTEGDDVLEGTSDRDVIVGLGGNDIIGGEGGDDIICGGPGDDKLDGDAGNDFIDAGPGDDEVDGGPGDDEIHGGEGNDNLDGGLDDDTIDGGPGNDECDGNGGANTIINCEP